MTSLAAHPLHPGLGVPLFISAGPLKEAAQLRSFLQITDPLMAPVLTLGSYSWPKWPGNASTQHPTDFVYYEALGMAGNARGIPNEGVEGMQALKEPVRQLSSIGIKTIISVTNLPHETAKNVIPQLVEAAAELEPTAIEINLSCPNGKQADGSLHAPLCNDVDASGEVMEESRRRVGVEVCLGGKDAPHVTSPQGMVDRPAVKGLIAVLNPFINFVTGINTIGGQPFPEITSTGGLGGMSGPIVVPVARQWLEIARESVSPDIAILSCGGVDARNVATEVPLRQHLGAMLIGGAQEFYRSGQSHVIARNWVQIMNRQDT